MTALLADCGGTFARFALVRDGRLGEPVALSAGMFEDFASAAAFFLDGEGAPALDAVAVGAAGPVEDGRIAMTNGCRWTLDPQALRDRFGAGRALAVNDFAAVAAALPALGPDDALVLHAGEARTGAALLAIGAGTGLGVGAAIPDGRGGHVVAAGEGGHAALAPATDRELAVVFHLMRAIGHVKAEAVLSGPGLETLHATLAALDGAPAGPQPTAGEIVARARGGTCALSTEAVTIFSAWLGGFAGDMALAFDARGGVVLAGGVVPRLIEAGVFDVAAFRRRFAAKGSHRPILERVPLRVATTPLLPFIGLAALLERAP